MKAQVEEVDKEEFSNNHHFEEAYITVVGVGVLQLASLKIAIRSIRTLA